MERIASRLRLNYETGCMEYMGARHKHGYGMVRHDGKVHTAHRLMYADTYGPTEKHVLHTCDNPACCNPNHLWAGTHTDNMRDMASKMRGNTAKLTPEQREEIRLAGGKQRDIAKRYGISQTHVWRIKNGA